MQATKQLLQQRQPMIRFLGKRTTPSKIDHTPQAHPAAPTHSLPNTFAQYRQQAQQHGPLNTPLGVSNIGRATGASLGPVEAGSGEYFDRSELEPKFAKLPWTLAEIEAIESGGATTVN